MELADIKLIKDSDTSAKLFRRKDKRYALKEMITRQEKQITQKKIKLNPKNVYEKMSEYFENMRKAQRQKMLITNFIKKLRRIIVRRVPIEHSSLQLHEQPKKFLNGVYIPPFLELLLSIFTILEISFLMIVISLSTVFYSVHLSSIYFVALAFGFLFHILDMLKSIASVKNQDGKRFENLNDIIMMYIHNQGISDTLILIAYLCQFCFHESQLTQISRYLFLLKAMPLLKKLEFLERQMIQNVYWEQVWELIKLFLVNYIFAHFLALVLISMAKLDDSENWMNFRNISQKPQVEQYIWAYYWATTIMLTVGFGDIAPVNTSQALCMIFVETISCILLAYNINNVGSIISKIRSYSQLQQTNLKTFRNLATTNVFPSELSHRITNYIKESVEMKRKSNISEENKFIETLPNSFKEDVLKQCNKKIFTDLLFFKNLSQKLQVELAIQIQRKLAHPEEIIHRRKDPLQILIFSSGTVAYTYFRQSNRTLHANGKVVQNHIIGKNQFKLLSLDFLFDCNFPFNVKCIDYTTVYKIGSKTLMQILKGNPYDYEYFCMMKDKDKMLLNEFEIDACELCEKEKHSLDRCPKLHYLPFKQHIIHKFLGNKLSIELMIRLYKPRMNKLQFNTLLDRKVIKNELLKRRFEQKDFSGLQTKRRSIFAFNNSENNFLNTQEPLGNGTHITLGANSSCVELQNALKPFTIEFDLIRQSQSIYKDAAQKIKDEMQKVIILQQNKDMMWDIQVDSIHDFKYYFKKYNAEILRISLKKKMKKRRKAKK